MIWTAPCIWDGGSCFIIGGGPSMPRQFGVPEDVVAKVVTGELPPAVYSPYLAPIHDKHVIGINNAYQIGSWLDCVFFGDWKWYKKHREALAKFRNLKVGCCSELSTRLPEGMEGIKYLPKGGGRRIPEGPVKCGISNNPHNVAWNKNSGAAAISLAVHFGVRRIILLGFDMNLGPDRVSHWHNGHPIKDPPKTFARHLPYFPAIAEDAKRYGVEILNASPGSAITSFPKVQLSEVLEGEKPWPLNS